MAETSFSLISRLASPILQDMYLEERQKKKKLGGKTPNNLKTSPALRYNISH